MALYWYMKKYVPLVILLALAILADIFSSRNNAEAFDPRIMQMIEQDHAKIDLVMGYLTSLQQKGILPTGKQ